MRYIDLFAGVGGFRYGIDRVNSARESETHTKDGSDSPNSDKRNQESFTCVYSNEWDRYANSVYKKHYGECDERDITTVKAEEIPDHDLLCGGFPCQAFSVAGKRKGFNDTRGTLFFEIARIAEQKQPSYLLLENVKGLLSHDKGKTFGRILETLDELGYDLQWQVLNSKDFGVPQNRERVFIVGNLRGQPRPEVFPITQTSEANLDYLGGVISDREMWLKDGKQNSRNFSQGQRIYSTKGIASTLAGNAGGLGGKTGLYATRQPLRFLNRNQRNIEGDYAFTVDASQTSGVRQGMRIRRLTPKECERLQGFPDNWTQTGHDGASISDTQRYKMMGNAVTTNVVTAIVSRLRNSL
jgi:DNA (cytosine-5)-methyltransferase 1